MPTTTPTLLQRITLNSSSPNSWIYTRPSTERMNPNNRLSNQIHPTPTPKSSTHILFTQPNRCLIPLPSHALESIHHTIQSEVLHTAIDVSQINNSMAGSWSIKVSRGIYKIGPKIPTGSENPSSTKAERGAYLHLLYDLCQICHQLKITKGKIKIYIDNLQVIDFFTLPAPGTGPTAFLIDDFDVLLGIKHYTKILQTQYNIELHKQHIYSHLESNTN